MNLWELTQLGSLCWKINYKDYQLTVGFRSHELTADAKLNMIIARIDQLEKDNQMKIEISALIPVGTLALAPVVLGHTILNISKRKIKMSNEQQMGNPFALTVTI